MIRSSAIKSLQSGQVSRIFGSFCFVALSFFLIQEHAYCDEKLVFSVDIVRHGDRNPITEIPKAPHSWQGELGGLTDAGLQREKNLGSQLRKEYVDQWKLLPDHYSAKTLYVRSTGFSRTKESAKALLEGLYPPGARGGIEIPVVSVDQNQEDLLLVHFSKNPFALVKLFFRKRNFWNEHVKDIQEELPGWRQATGLKLDGIEDLIQLGDNLFIRQTNRIQFPSGINQVAANKIISLAQLAMVSHFEQREVSAPSGTKIISTVKQYFDQKIHGTSELSYVLYLAHDSTIMATLSALGAKVQYPSYASRLNFSLFKEEERYRVRVSHDGKDVDVPQWQR